LEKKSPEKKVSGGYVADLLTILNAARHYGLKKALPIIQFTSLRNRLDREYQIKLQAQQSSFTTLPGKLHQVKTLSNGASFRFDHAQLELIFLAPDLVRITWEPGILPVPYALARTDWPLIKISLSQKDDDQKNNSWQLASSELSVMVQAQGSVRFYDSDGNLLREDLPPIQSLNPETPAWSGTARLQVEECIYGLGEQTSSLNRRGTTCRMWNTDPMGAYEPGDDPLYMPMPVYLGLHSHGSYLIFYENSYPATFRFDPFSDGNQASKPEAWVAFESGALRYYFIPGYPADALQRFSELTGRAGLPPRWSLGYHQSRWGYKSAADIRQVVQGFREHDLPLGVIHLDIDYMDGFRVFTVDPQRFPDLPGLVRELDEQGIKVVTIIDPGVKQDPEYLLYQSGLQEGAFCRQPDGELLVGAVWPGKSVFPDFTNPLARAWWGRAYASLLEAGVAGIWHDMNEPTSFAVTGGPFLPLATGHHLEGQEGDHRQAHNLYALLMNRVGFESLRHFRPTHRPWILSRSGWVSQARYAWNWTGDTSTSWQSLRLTIPLVLGTGLSGQPYSGPDIGGFSGTPSAELYLRWFQMATFLPFFRTHSAQSTAQREPWVFGEPFTTIIRNFIHLRYRLLPYLYSLAWEISQNGQPFVRPLFWNEPQAAALWQIDDEFMLGESLLIAPLLEEGRPRRTITLPSGRWSSWWDDQIYSGPGEIEIECGLEHIPVFIRQGSLLPLDEENRLVIHVYAPEPGQSAAYRLYSDAGDGSPVPGEQEFRLDDFQVFRSAEALEIAWRNEGSYPFPYSQVDLELHGYEFSRATLDGQPLPTNAKRLHLPLPAGNSRRIVIE
jgi:alpha-glucosidase